ncbi:hypothetical protein [Pseudomonas phage vB_PaeM_PS119XW]|uniref:Uncharacterized protein n=1 Tax=Pseudomonas phage vB_PaeM_PS119XW TaxID=2601632 RepID=A0A5C1K8B3_9CAUD|nr:hypothetical protein PP933_gp002 [Pseudomonas phage vB_PaeM_PS119XW]QEM41731.1 hypothetical protein [Pseudomonas phage vB_PaeM_PS119XW]
MTAVNYPFVDTMDKFDKITKGLIFEHQAEGESETMISHELSILDNDGVVHSLHFNQITSLIDTITGKHPSLELPPQLFLITQYLLEDLKEVGEKGFVITEYFIDVLPSGNKAIFRGTLAHKSTVDGHPDFDPESTVGKKEFEFSLNQFSILQQIALSHCIANLHEECAVFRGTFDVEYTFHWTPFSFNVKFAE